MKIKILSWNIFIYGRFGKLADFLKAFNADIIGLQEVLDDDPERPVIPFLNKLGYKHVFAPVEKTWGAQTWNDGPAIFSKFDILKAKTHLLSEKDTRAAAQADIKVGGKMLHIFSTHLTHTHQQSSQAQDEQVANLIRVLPSENTIVMGDFNATPDSSTIKAMQQVLSDADPSSAPTWSTTPDGCGVCKPSSIDTRLDYIFFTRDIKMHSFKIEQSKASDHLPISVTMEI